MVECISSTANDANSPNDGINVHICNTPVNVMVVVQMKPFALVFFFFHVVLWRSAIQNCHKSGS